MTAAFWPAVLTAAGVGGVPLAIIQGLIYRRKVGADTAKVLTDAATGFARQLRSDNEKLHADNELLSAQVAELRADKRQLSDQVADLQREVRELKGQISRMQRDVTATRTAVERQEHERESGGTTT